VNFGCVEHLTEREVEKLIDAAKGAALMSAIGVTATKPNFGARWFVRYAPKWTSANASWELFRCYRVSKRDR
jgi:hypothetical protein